MKLRKFPTVLSIAAATATCAMAAPASADPDWGGARAASSHKTDDFTEPTPNVDLIASGIFTLAIPYIASVAAASESTRQGDNYLYTPVAGPWLDLAHRDDCPAFGSCGNEAAYRVLLVADGLLQGFGALEILSGFMFPVEQPVKNDSSPHVRVVPSVAHNTGSITAVGTF